MIRLPITQPFTRNALIVAGLSLGLRIASARFPFLAPFTEELTGLTGLAFGVAVMPAGQRVEVPK